MKNYSSIQSDILNSLKSFSEPVVSTDVGASFLKSLSEYDPMFARQAFGIYGTRIHYFAQKIDYNNLTLNLIFDGQLVSTKPDSFNYTAQEYLKFISANKGWEKSKLIKDNLVKLISRHPAWGKIKRLNDPKVTEKFVRLLKSKSDRDDVRNQEGYQLVDIAAFAKNREGYWNQVSDLTDWYRHTKIEKKQTTDLKDKLDLFAEVGLINLAVLVKKEIATEEKQNKEKDYFGFRKISGTRAAILVAKINDFELKASVKNVFLPSLSDVKIIQKGKDNFYPLMFNYSKFKGINPICDEMVELCDALPANNKTPIFDNYKVLMPSTVMPYTEIGLEKGIIINNLNDKNIIGILLGQKDESLYFLNYFS
jgi:hypothetical protein